MLVDSHCHLDFDSFDEDRELAVQRAFDAGVGTMVTICTRVSRFEEIRDIARRNDRIWCSVGIHPHQVAEEGRARAEELVRLAEDPKVVGIGETGTRLLLRHEPAGRSDGKFSGTYCRGA